MEYTRKMLADELGCTKQTIATYAKGLDLDGHVVRRGQTDYYDEVAASAIASRASGRFARRQEAEADDPADLLQTMLEHYKSEVDRLRVERDAVEARHEAEIERLQQLLIDERGLTGMIRSQLMDEARKAKEAASRAEKAEAEASRYRHALAVIEVAPFWKRASLARTALALPAPSTQGE